MSNPVVPKGHIIVKLNDGGYRVEKREDSPEPPYPLSVGYCPACGQIRTFIEVKTTVGRSFKMICPNPQYTGCSQ